MTEHCIFCNANQDAVLHRGEDGIVLLDDPVRAGHVLVGSRVHGESLHDLSPDDAAALLRLANRVSKAIVALTGAAKVYIAAIGDKDKHFHVHLLPKFDGEPNLGPHVFGPNGWTSFLPSQPDAGEVERTNDAIRNALIS
jgi:diadenosine tetraphosphate (Ap4A) HIT family hydrolase